VASKRGMVFSVVLGRMGSIGVLGRPLLEEWALAELLIGLYNNGKRFAPVEFILSKVVIEKCAKKSGALVRPPIQELALVFERGPGSNGGLDRLTRKQWRQ